ncbi:MAG: glycosyltransferase [Clostridia bacterium]|nr:glycosyltransferase [Clostridia bacterium]
MGSADVGGIASVVFNYMKHIDQEEYHFDFAVNAIKPGYLENRMIEMGAKFYRLPLRSHGLSEYSKALRDLLAHEQFEAIHVHSNSVSYVDLRVARQLGIICRIAHAHSTGFCSTPQDYIRKYAGQVLNFHYATTVIGCGQKAGDEIFGKRHMRSAKGLVLPNAIETEKFRFQDEYRGTVRRELGLNDEYVIGMVGRLTPEKNCGFAVRVMKELGGTTGKIVLLMIGDGEERNSLERLIDEYGLDGRVRLLGLRTDIERFYSAMDILIMPSLYEGFPMTGIEAITTGLPVVFSDHITRELEFGQGVRYLPLDVRVWADALAAKHVNHQREEGYLEAWKHGYDIKQTVRKLEEVYQKAGKN